MAIILVIIADEYTEMNEGSPSSSICMCPLSQKCPNIYVVPHLRVIDKTSSQTKIRYYYFFENSELYFLFKTSTLYGWCFELFVEKMGIP